MSDTRRTQQEGGLADLLAQQLNALADEWAPAGRHFVRMSHTDPAEDSASTQAGDLGGLEDEIREDDVRVDDVPALIARSFDYEAALWLWQCAAAPGSRTIH